jgi:hypothetical protein
MVRNDLNTLWIVKNITRVNLSFDALQSSKIRPPIGFLGIFKQGINVAGICAMRNAWLRRRDDIIDAVQESLGCL